MVDFLLIGSEEEEDAGCSGTSCGSGEGGRASNKDSKSPASPASFMDDKEASRSALENSILPKLSISQSSVGVEVGMMP